ncbi:hypothetical protein HUW46_04489 [Amycolatopsis sp. CA-230715]|nr:hypothetical protein HUW46_04489 [Amycolatopsis sp. CA-230715]
MRAQHRASPGSDADVGDSSAGEVSSLATVGVNQSWNSVSVRRGSSVSHRLRPSSTCSNNTVRSHTSSSGGEGVGSAADLVDEPRLGSGSGTRASSRACRLTRAPVPARPVPATRRPRCTVAEAGSGRVAPPTRRPPGPSSPLRRALAAAEAAHLPATAARWLAPTTPATRKRPADAMRSVPPTAQARAAGQGPEGNPLPTQPPPAAPAPPVSRGHRRLSPRSPHGPLRHATNSGEAANALLSWLPESRRLRRGHGCRRKRVATAGLTLVVLTENDSNPACSHHRVPPSWNCAMRRGHSTRMAPGRWNSFSRGLIESRMQFDGPSQRRTQATRRQWIEHREIGAVDGEPWAVLGDRNLQVRPAAVAIAARHCPRTPQRLPASFDQQSQELVSITCLTHARHPPSAPAAALGASPRFVRLSAFANASTVTGIPSFAARLSR